VNRFLRSALFPVVVITLIVWLGTQTLIGKRTSPKKVTTSEVIQTVKDHPGDIREVIFKPNRRQAEIDYTNNTKATVYYASDQAQANFQQLLEKKNVTFDSKGIGSSAWWSILTSLLPFVLLFGFWIFLMNQVQGGGSKVMSFGKSRAKRMTPDSPKIGFKDVAVADLDRQVVRVFPQVVHGEPTRDLWGHAHQQPQGLHLVAVVRDEAAQRRCHASTMAGRGLGFTNLG
jgi:cell division protease FtsH